MRDMLSGDFIAKTKGYYNKSARVKTAIKSTTSKLNHFSHNDMLGILNCYQNWISFTVILLGGN